MNVLGGGTWRGTFPQDSPGAKLLGGSDAAAKTLDSTVVKNLPVRQETQVQSLSQEGPLEKEMAQG